MIRKSILALTAIAALGAAALAPTSASAWGFKGGWGGGWGHHHFHGGYGGYGFYGARYVDVGAGLLLREARQPLRQRAPDPGLRVIAAKSSTMFTPASREAGVSSCPVGIVSV